MLERGERNIRVRGPYCQPPARPLDDNNRIQICQKYRDFIIYEKRRADYKRNRTFSQKKGYYYLTILYDVQNPSMND